MPSKSLVSSGETNVKNFKQSKDRVTLLGCANASRTCKLPLAFIHKSARPRCFKHTDMNVSQLQKKIVGGYQSFSTMV